MNSKKIDILNIGLIILSLIIAVQLPFKLFLLSYAILGPLHYLTEIHWLNEQNFFVGSKKNWLLPFIVIALLLSSAYFILNLLNLGRSVYDLSYSIATNANLLILSAFIFSLSLIFIREKKLLIISLMGSIIIATAIGQFTPNLLSFLGFSLPTIIHVFLFTLCFMVFGSLKNKSKFGFLAASLLVCIPFVISYLPINPQNYNLVQEVSHTYNNSIMINLNIMLAHILGTEYHSLSEIGLKIQIFIAFAYTYHYINWFSKTSIIGWKRSMKNKNFTLILLIWALSVGIYYYDFNTGLLALLFLSFLHVFLEFPLNVISIKEILAFGFKPKNKS